MIILGVSGLYHDSSAAIIRDGDIVAAAQEERFTRKKHDSSMPANSIRFCLNQAGCKPEDIDYVVFYDNSLLTLDRFLQNVRAIGRDSIDLINYGFDKMFSQKIWIKEIIRSEFPTIFEKAHFMVTKHHIAHAASAFYPSPYSEAISLTIDGVGEWSTLTIGKGHRNKLKLLEEMKYPDSLGLFYSAFTYFCGFKVNSGDYKFMGLAPYGKPVYEQIIRKEIIDIKADGSFKLNMKYFDYQNGRTMINEEKMAKLFGGNRRLPETKITQREMDLAASVQKITEDIVILIAEHAKEKYGSDCDNLVLAGGVALNCVANGKLLKKGVFKNIWIQPAAGDAGGALGAALFLYYDYLNNERILKGEDLQKGSYLGPEFSNDYIIRFLNKEGYPYHDAGDEMPRIVADLLDRQMIVGFFQGKMEFGPRALGARSIIADPRSEKMQAKLNLKIKFRESFRPFAPSVLSEYAKEYFELHSDSPYMLLCADVNENRRIKFNLPEVLDKSDMNMLKAVSIKRSDIPAVTHVDYSARIQTVDGKWNPKYRKVIEEFYSITGCPVIVNTSFNVRGEPIVCTPEDAYRCFMRSEMDVLVLENMILYRDEQPKVIDEIDWRKQYELD